MENIESKVGLLGHGVVVKPNTEASQTSGGIHIPNANKRSNGMRDGKVVAIGSDVKAITVGMEIFYYSNLGTEMIIDGDKYIFLDIEKREVKGFYK